MYMNLSNGGTSNGSYSVTEGGVSRTPATGARDFGTAPFGVSVSRPRPSQAWLSIAMQAEGRYAVEFDAAALGNGCSLPGPIITYQGAPIAPSPNATP